MKTIFAIYNGRLLAFPEAFRTVLDGDIGEPSEGIRIRSDIRDFAALDQTFYDSFIDGAEESTDESTTANASVFPSIVRATGESLTRVRFEANGLRQWKNERSVSLLISADDALSDAFVAEENARVLLRSGSRAALMLIQKNGHVIDSEALEELDDEDVAVLAWRVGHVSLSGTEHSVITFGDDENAQRYILANETSMLTEIPTMPEEFDELAVPVDGTITVVNEASSKVVLGERDGEDVYYVRNAGASYKLSKQYRDFVEARLPNDGGMIYMSISGCRIDYGYQYIRTVKDNVEVDGEPVENGTLCLVVSMDSDGIVPEKNDNTPEIMEKIDDLDAFEFVSSVEVTVMHDTSLVVVKETGTNVKPGIGTASGTPYGKLRPSDGTFEVREVSYVSEGGVLKPWFHIFGAKDPETGHEQALSQTISKTHGWVSGSGIGAWEDVPVTEEDGYRIKTATGSCVKVTQVVAPVDEEFEDVFAYAMTDIEGEDEHEETVDIAQGTRLELIRTAGPVLECHVAGNDAVISVEASLLGKANGIRREALVQISDFFEPGAFPVRTKGYPVSETEGLEIGAFVAIPADDEHLSLYKAFVEDDGDDNTLDAVLSENRMEAGTCYFIIHTLTHSEQFVELYDKDGNCLGWAKRHRVSVLHAGEFVESDRYVVQSGQTRTVPFLSDVVHDVKIGQLFYAHADAFVDSLDPNQTAEDQKIGYSTIVVSNVDGETRLSGFTDVLISEDKLPDVQFNDMPRKSVAFIKDTQGSFDAVTHILSDTNGDFLLVSDHASFAHSADIVGTSASEEEGGGLVGFYGKASAGDDAVEPVEQDGSVVRDALVKITVGNDTLVVRDSDIYTAGVSIGSGWLENRSFILRKESQMFFDRPEEFDGTRSMEYELDDVFSYVRDIDVGNHPGLYLELHDGAVSPHTLYAHRDDVFSSFTPNAPLYEIHSFSNTWSAYGIYEAESIGNNVDISLSSECTGYQYYRYNKTSDGFGIVMMGEGVALDPEHDPGFSWKITCDDGKVFYVTKTGLCVDESAVTINEELEVNDYESPVYLWLTTDPEGRKRISENNIISFEESSIVPATEPVTLDIFSRAVANPTDEDIDTTMTIDPHGKVIRVLGETADGSYYKISYYPDKTGFIAKPSNLYARKVVASQRFCIAGNATDLSTFGSAYSDCHCEMDAFDNELEVLRPGDDFTISWQTDDDAAVAVLLFEKKGSSALHSITEDRIVSGDIIEIEPENEVSIVPEFGASAPCPVSSVQYGANVTGKGLVPLTETAFPASRGFFICPDSPSACDAFKAARVLLEAEYSTRKIDDVDNVDIGEFAWLETDRLYRPTHSVTLGGTTWYRIPVDIGRCDVSVHSSDDGENSPEYERFGTVYVWVNSYDLYTGNILERVYPETRTFAPTQEVTARSYLSEYALTDRRYGTDSDGAYHGMFNASKECSIEGNPVTYLSVIRQNDEHDYIPKDQCVRLVSMLGPVYVNNSRPDVYDAPCSFSRIDRETHDIAFYPVVKQVCSGYTDTENTNDRRYALDAYVKLKSEQDYDVPATVWLDAKDIALIRSDLPEELKVAAGTHILVKSGADGLLWESEDAAVLHSFYDDTDLFLYGWTDDYAVVFVDFSAECNNIGNLNFVNLNDYNETGLMYIAKSDILRQWTDGDDTPMFEGFSSEDIFKVSFASGNVPSSLLVDEGVDGFDMRPEMFIDEDADVFKGDAFEVVGRVATSQGTVLGYMLRGTRSEEPRTGYCIINMSEMDLDFYKMSSVGRLGYVLDKNGVESLPDVGSLVELPYQFTRNTDLYLTSDGIVVAAAIVANVPRVELCDRVQYSDVVTKSSQEIIDSTQPDVLRVEDNTVTTYGGMTYSVSGNNVEAVTELFDTPAGQGTGMITSFGNESDPFTLASIVKYYYSNETEPSNLFDPDEFTLQSASQLHNDGIIVEMTTDTWYSDFHQADAVTEVRGALWYHVNNAMIVTVEDAAVPDNVKLYVENEGYIEKASGTFIPAAEAGTPEMCSWYESNSELWYSDEDTVEVTGEKGYFEVWTGLDQGSNGYGDGNEFASNPAANWYVQIQMDQFGDGSVSKIENRLELGSREDMNDDYEDMYLIPFVTQTLENPNLVRLSDLETQGVQLSYAISSMYGVMMVMKNTDIVDIVLVNAPGVIHNANSELSALMNTLVGKSFSMDDWSYIHGYTETHAGRGDLAYSDDPSITMRLCFMTAATYNGYKETGELNLAYVFVIPYDKRAVPVFLGDRVLSGSDPFVLIHRDATSCLDHLEVEATVKFEEVSTYKKAVYVGGSGWTTAMKDAE